MQRTAAIPVLTLEGTPRQRGRAHGEALRSLILASTERWKEDIHREVGIHPQAYIEKLVHENGFVRATERWAPELLQEVEGIAEGAALDPTTAFARQLGDEDFWFRTLVKDDVATITPERCSSLGSVAEDGATLIAQNMDLPAYWDGFQVLLHIKHRSGMESLVFSVAGTLALCGINSSGVGLCCNTILQCNYDRQGLPEVLVVRTVLERSSFGDARAFVEQATHASPQNYVLGGPGSVVDLEVSANQVCVFAPVPGAARVYHTNHAVVNDDQSIYLARLAAMLPAQREALPGRSTTLARLQSLAAHLGDLTQPITVEKAKETLCSHDGPVCRDAGGDSITLGCCIMELAPHPRLHLSPGPPCSTDFETYSL